MTTATLARACEHCGAAFTPKRSDARFCSDGCRNAAHRSGRRSDPVRSVATANRLATVTAIRAESLTWEPPAERRRAYLTDEPCPGCGGMLHSAARGTWRACLPCVSAVVPPAVAAPYERGQGGAQQRQVTTQRERDLDEIALAGRKGAMLAQLDQLAADDRLHPESVPVVEWFSAAVKAAKSGGRLDQLAELLPQAGIRRRHWWQGQPAAISAEYDDEPDDDDDSGGLDEGPRVAARPLSIEAAPLPSRGPVTWADAVSACGWRLSPVVGGCQIVDSAGHLCGAGTTRRITGGWVCSHHQDALCDILYAVQRQR